MCGRYRLSRQKESLAERFGVEPDDNWQPRYNIAPTQDVPVIRQHSAEPKRLGSRMRWGLIPSWAKDGSTGFKMINARAETVTTKPAFLDALRKRRCLISADGFFEWAKNGKSKTPFCFTMENLDQGVISGRWGTVFSTVSPFTMRRKAPMSDRKFLPPEILLHTSQVLNIPMRGVVAVRPKG